MFSTAVTDAQNRSTPPNGGQPAANPAQGQNFVAVLNRLAYSSLAASTVATGTPLPDTTAPEPPESAPQPRTDRSADASHEVADTDGTERQNADADWRSRPADEGRDDASDTVARSDDAPPAPPRPAEKPDAADASRRPDAAQQTAAAASTPRGAAASAGTQGPNGTVAAAQAQTAAQTGNETPAAPQTGREGAGRPAASGTPQITAQVSNGAAEGQLPQLGHTLSSRAAVVAQSDATKSAPQNAALKNASADPASSAVVSGAAQTNSLASKNKGQAKTGNEAAKGAAASGNPSAGQQASQAAAAEAQAAAVSQAAQQRPIAAQTGAGTLAGTAGQQASGARAEPFTLAGSGGTGSTEFSPRGTAPAPAAKPAPPPVPARVITNQVAVQIQKAFGAGGDRISIQLKPAELGRVDVRLDVGGDGRVAAVITADRADTLDLLQRDARILQNALQDAGLQADGNSLSFELKGQDHAFDGSPKGSDQSGAADETDDDATVSSDGAARTSNGIIADDRVDIQV